MLALNDLIENFVIFLYLILFSVGIFLLIKSSDLLIDGASSIASKLKVSPIVIGLTIVAFGTSAPELVVSISAVLSGSSDIALGNVIGSNIFNILAILGISSIISTLQVKKGTAWKEIPFSLLASIFVALFVFRSFINTGQTIDFSNNTKLATLGATEGLILLSFFIIFIYYTLLIAKEQFSQEDFEQYTSLKSVIFIILGLLGLSLSAKYLVTDSAVQIARYLNISEEVIGLTLVSIGTGLPELTTSIRAALKNKSDLAIGNVVGSNIFNLTLILALVAIIKPIDIYTNSIADLFALIVSTLILFGLLFIPKRYRLGKIEGVAMVALYLIFLVYIIIR